MSKEGEPEVVIGLESDGGVVFVARARKTTSFVVFCFSFFRRKKN